MTHKHRRKTYSFPSRSGVGDFMQHMAEYQELRREAGKLYVKKLEELTQQGDLMGAFLLVGRTNGWI